MPSSSQAVPLIEHFGPVIQGEGQLIGLTTWFVRLGGCDYTCNYCDSMHAVDGRLISKNAQVMSALDIAKKVDAAIGICPMITLSGGNPALYEMSDFIDYFRLHQHTKMVAIETQGTAWKSWIGFCDYITVSPKGPSMIGTNESRLGIKAFIQFMTELSRYKAFCHRIAGSDAEGVCVKIPVFDSADLEYACIIKRTMQAHGFDVPLYLSIGNSWVPKPAPLGGDVPELSVMRQMLLDRYAKLSQTVMVLFPELHSCPILPQLHVLLFGNELRR